MTNKVELLRSLCFTKEDMETITKVSENTKIEDIFSDKEIEFMVEFKKIYELGLDQLEKFIKKMDEEGNKLDEYSIMYYVRTLLNGPLANYVRKLAVDKKYFLVKTPETIGQLGNTTRGPSNITAYLYGGYQLGTSVDVYNKLPLFSQVTLSNSVKITEDVFRSSLKSSTEVDNTLPIVDKSNQRRYTLEPIGRWSILPNGNYIVKDSIYYIVIANTSERIFTKVKDLLGEDDFRIFKSKKEYNPFDPKKNLTTGGIYKIEKEVEENKNKRKIDMDIMGDEYDSEKRRKSVLKVVSNDKTKEYQLNSNTGQLGA